MKRKTFLLTLLIFILVLFVIILPGCKTESDPVLIMDGIWDVDLNGPNMMLIITGNGSFWTGFGSGGTLTKVGNVYQIYEYNNPAISNPVIPNPGSDLEPETNEQTSSTTAMFVMSNSSDLKYIGTATQTSNTTAIFVLFNSNSNASAYYAIKRT